MDPECAKVRVREQIKIAARNIESSGRRQMEASVLSGSMDADWDHRGA
jgi:hypothetical protein